MADTDENLARRVRADDRTAFGELFDRHHRRLYAFLCPNVESHALAEDLTQESLWKAWERRHQYDAEMSINDRI
jgi:RNA polymerase sigma-70 factor (ECF subfamily)